MEDIFYSAAEKIAFWVSGYNDSYNVNEQIKMLEKCKHDFAQQFKSGIRIDGMMTRMITKSSRYLSMRVFWIKTDQIPAKAFILAEWRDGNAPKPGSEGSGFYHINNEKTQYWWNQTDRKWYTPEEDYNLRKELEVQPVVTCYQPLYWTMEKWLSN